MDNVYLNRIVTAVPDYDIHGKFIDYAPSLLRDERSRLLFKRMAGRSHIEHRYSFLKPASDVAHLDADNFYRANAFPSTEARMRLPSLMRGISFITENLEKNCVSNTSLNYNRKVSYAGFFVRRFH